MQTFKSFLDQAFLIWKDSTGAARFGIGLLLLLCAGAIVGVGIWSSQPYYVDLARGLEPSQMRKVIAALESDGIKYELKGSGSIIRVDKQKLDRAQVAAGGLGIESGNSQFKETGIWEDPKSRAIKNRLNLELALERTVERYRFVDSAEIHLNIPVKEAFLRTRNAPSATVVLEIDSRAQFSDSQAMAIASTIANSVDSLVVDRVSITDTDGNKYTTDPARNSQVHQEDIRVSRDRELEDKVEKVLFPIVGLGNAMVTVTTEFSYPNRTTVTNEFDPKQKAILRELITKDTKTIGSRSTSDPAAENVIEKKESEDIDYALSETRVTEEVKTPVLMRKSVSVVVNPAEIMDENDLVPPVRIASINSLVSKAVGFLDETDEITIEYSKFVDFLPLEEPVGFTIPWDRVNQILKSLSLGLAAIVALLVGFKALKKIQPDPVTTHEAVERSGQVNQLSELVQQNPEVFSKIIESWSNLDSSSDESRQSKAA